MSATSGTVKSGPEENETLKHNGKTTIDIVASTNMSEYRVSVGF